MATPKKNPGDFTAKQRADAAASAAADQELLQQTLTMATKAEEIRLTDTVIDLTGDDEGEDDADEVLEPVSDLNTKSTSEGPDPVVNPDLLAPAEITLVSEKTVTIRVNAPIKDMTYGAGRYYSFEIGPKYKVPADLGAYLDSLGYVWH